MQSLCDSTACSSPLLHSTRPWDPLNDLIQFEKDGCIQTKVRHRTPMVRSGSLISLSNQGPRRDNCKCQVGYPDQKTPFQKPSKHLAASATFNAAPGAPSSLSLLLFMSSLLCCCHCGRLCSFFFLCSSTSDLLFSCLLFCVYGRTVMSHCTPASFFLWPYEEMDN